MTGERSGAGGVERPLEGAGGLGRNVLRGRRADHRGGAAAGHRRGARDPEGVHLAGVGHIDPQHQVLSHADLRAIEGGTGLEESGLGDR